METMEKRCLEDLQQKLKEHDAFTRTCLDRVLGSIENLEQLAQNFDVYDIDRMLHRLRPILASEDGGGIVANYIGRVPTSETGGIVISDGVHAGKAVEVPSDDSFVPLFMLRVCVDGPMDGMVVGVIAIH